MRFPDDFASLDLRQQALATRMLHHEARTSTIAAWTGLGADRIRGLAARLSPEQRARALHRVRGHAPTQFHSFLRPHARHREAAALAALLQEVGALGPDLERPASAFAPFESLERGEKLCQAYERYRGADTQGAIPFDYAVLLLTTLAHTRELALALCANCREPWLLDVYGAPDQHCPRCSPRSQLVSLVYGSRAPPGGRGCAADIRCGRPPGRGRGGAWGRGGPRPQIEEGSILVALEITLERAVDRLSG